MPSCGILRLISKNLAHAADEQALENSSGAMRM